MNSLPNFKIEKLSEKLAEIDSEITKNFDTIEDNYIRALIDRRRHFLALLGREILASGDQHISEISDVYKPRPELDQSICCWCNRIKTLKIHKISFECSVFCNLLLDHTLPTSWNFDDDLMVIHQPISTDILEVAKERNQKHIIIYVTEGTPSSEIIDLAKLHKFFVCTSIESLERTVSLLQVSAQQVISISCESNQANVLEAKAAIADAVNAGKRTRTENTATVSRFGKSWATNTLKNLRCLQGSKNLHQLKISGVEDAIIVASGPSLNKNVAKLREVQDSVFIVSALRSLPILNSEGIEPDLIIQLDAEDEKTAQDLSSNISRPVKNLLLEGTVDNGFFKIPANNIIWSFPQHFFDIHDTFGTKPTPFNVPSVSIYALSLCQFLRFKNICFIGQDLAASCGKQYADGATDLLPAHANMSMFQIEVPGFFGDTVLTRNSYQYQIKRCSEIAREWEQQQLELNLVNATEGGAYISGFNHMTLDEFIEQRQLRTIHTHKSIDFSSNFAITADRIDCYLQSINNTMTRISNIADMIVKLDKQTEKTHGIDKKIKKLARKFQDANDTTSLLQIAMQESIANVLGTSRKVETVDTYAQFFEKVKSTASLLKAAAKG